MNDVHSALNWLGDCNDGNAQSYADTVREAYDAGRALLERIAGALEDEIASFGTVPFDPAEIREFLEASA